MSLAILPEPISVSLFRHLVSQGPAAGCQVSLCYLCSEMGSLDLHQACSGPFSTCSISVSGDDSGVPGCEGFDDCSTGLPASGAPRLPASGAPGLPGSSLTLFCSLPPPGLVWFWFFHPLPSLLPESLAVFSTPSLHYHFPNTHIDSTLASVWGSGWLWVRKVALAVEPVPVWLLSQGPDMRMWH